jgi:hypothetical protein
MDDAPRMSIDMESLPSSSGSMSRSTLYLFPKTRELLYDDDDDAPLAPWEIVCKSFRWDY